MDWDMQDFTEELAMEWLKKPCWSIAESVFLLGENQIPVSRLAGYPLPPEFAGNAGKDMDNLVRAIVARQLQPIASVEGSIRGRFPVYAPTDVISVAESIDFGKWENWKRRLLGTQIQTNPEMHSAIMADIAAKTSYRTRKIPAPLFGDGFSEEMRKITTLTKYLELDTWTPIEAAMLVSGLQPPQGCSEIPKGAMGLDNSFHVGTDDWFHLARRVLQLWESQMNPPAKVTPRDFVAWCKTKNIDTSWLAEIESDTLQPTAKAPKGEINQDEQAEQQPEAIQEKVNHNHDAELAALFDPVGIPQLEKMFPAEGQWKKWANKAKEKRLDVARDGWGKYNPYRAALWWIETRKPTGWDIARINRTLANNLPARSRDCKYLLTGELD